jgi:SAM-dependent methyltransferase
VSDTEDDRSAYARRISSEIGVFARQGSLHRLAGIADWRNGVFLDPPLREAFGHMSAASIYAATIAAAIERCGAQKVFSLGCGDGEQEIAVLRAADQLGLRRFRIHGLELSPISLARAQSAAEAAGLSERFIVLEHDLNRGIPAGETPAAVIAHHVLHHIVALEPLLESIEERLHPGGVLVSFDMIGRNGHMLWPEVRPLVRRLWAMLPAAKHHDHVFGRPMPYYQDWDCAIEGFEGVRAQDILRLIAERFVPEALVVWGGISQVFLSDRAGPGFDPDAAADRAFIAAVQTLEADLLERRCTTPTEMGAAFRPRRGGFRGPAEAAACLARSVRMPGERFAAILDPGFPSPFPPVPAAELPVLAHDAVNRIQPGSPAAAALREGWEAPERDGVWAILDEQSIVFRLHRPVTRMDLHIWNPCPTTSHQTLLATTQAGGSARLGPLAEKESAILRLDCPGPPQTQWDIRIGCSTYLRPDQDGLVDRRPLSWRLTGIDPGGQGSTGMRGFAGRLGASLRTFRGSRRR